ncbi:MAG: hypothetical protein ACOYVF_14890 [Candidatus Zixiibacteriota bacterium]
MNNAKYCVIALMSVSLIALELVWTRIFSAEFFYTFAFLTLSLAVLGLGLGALALHLFSFLNRKNILGLSLSLSATLALVGPPLVFKIGLQFSQLFHSWTMVGKFSLTVALLSSVYFFAGIALARLFKTYNRNMPRLYMADLLGAGGGVVLAIWMMNTFGTPDTVFLITLPLLLAALIACRSWSKILPAVIAVAVFFLPPHAEQMLETPRPERGPVIYKHWDAMAKVKMFDFGTHRGIEIDNVANSPLYPFDGNWDRPDSMRFEFGIAVDYLIRQFDSCTFLSMGAGGGVDVLQALQEGATEIHAVEVNPHINKMMVEGDPSGYLPPTPPAPDSLAADSVSESAPPPDTAVPKIITAAEYSGYIYKDPRVKVVTEDVRTYIKRFKNKFDVIYSLSSNTWSALASGAFSLAENYLFTTEAFEDYWQALSDSGFMMMEHQFYMPRLVSEAMLALKNQGVENITDHFAVYDLPMMRRNILLLSKRSLTDSLRYHAIFDLTEEAIPYIHLLYPPVEDSLKSNLINRIVENGWEHEADSVPIDISPCSDNRPFIAQMGMWKNFQWDKLDKVLPYEFFGFPLSQLIIIIIMMVVLAIVVPLNLIPFFMKKPRLKAVPWLYFFTIGAAFMIVEVTLIQKYTLFVGLSVYSIAVILLTLLVGSGIGSRFSDRNGDTTAFGMIFIWLLLEIFAFGHLTSALSSLTVYPRMLVTALLIFPLGFFMGMPFPKGTLMVGELIDWGFAVNGAASVLGSTATVLVAVTYGFNIALLIGAVLYLLAYGFISLKKAW